MNTDVPKPAVSFAEMVVLAVVVGLLAMMVHPILFYRSHGHGTGEKPRRSSCLNNLKQIGLAMRLYSADYDERFPCDSAGTTVGSFALLTNKYQTSYKTWICPSDSSTISAGSPTSPFTSNNTSYAYGGFGLSETAQPDTPIAADRSSSCVGVWGDIVSPYAGNRWTHKSDGGNVLFADGHVAFQKTFVPPMYLGKNP